MGESTQVTSRAKIQEAPYTYKGLPPTEAELTAQCGCSFAHPAAENRLYSCCQAA